MPFQQTLAEQLERTDALDGVDEVVHRTVNRWLPAGPVKDALQGAWLGHPFHALLTDLPIGFWTSAWVLDLVGGPQSRSSADKLVALGVVSAVPTAAAGVADWSELARTGRRVGIVHAASNLTATTLYALSYVARRRGRRGAGVALGMLGAGAATVGGFLGGHLSYGGPFDEAETEADGPSQQPGVT